MKVKLNDVRLAFPVLYEPKGVNDGEPRFSAAFLFPPDHPAATAVTKAQQEVAKAKWGAKAGEVYKLLKANDRLALHDGASKGDYAGYEGSLFVNTSNKLRPLVIDQSRAPLTPDTGKPYSGCFVNGVVELWPQDNRFGKRINASLMGVQFLRDGERLAGGAVASEDDFESIPGAEGAAAVFDEEPDDDIPF